MEFALINRSTRIELRAATTAVHSSCISVALLALMSCRVYDPALVEQRESRAEVRRGETTEEAADAGEQASDAASTPPTCGDGVVDEGERCDTAIDRGEPGACPDGCSGGEGCQRNELVGDACQARCERREIETAKPNDGCCPDGADHGRDPDCQSECGNARVEPGETCDPPETCKQAEHCMAADVCERALYSGDPDQCSANCEITRIESCHDGDDCCPIGCDASNDDDCPAAEPPFECGRDHATTDCQRCDCERCGPETEACLATEAVAARCNGVIACAEREHCSGLACYCGDVHPDSCEADHPGLCAEAIESAAYELPARLILSQYDNAMYPLGRAIAVLNCRQQQCKTECGL